MKKDLCGAKMMPWGPVSSCVNTDIQIMNMSSLIFRYLIMIFSFLYSDNEFRQWNLRERESQHRNGRIYISVQSWCHDATTSFFDRCVLRNRSNGSCDCGMLKPPLEHVAFWHFLFGTFYLSCFEHLDSLSMFFPCISNFDAIICSVP